jgi:uncharacterized OB-fold protein
VRTLSGTVFAASVARPSGRLGPLAIEAPDEDGFTLAIAAAEALPAAPDRTRPERIDLVGDIPADAEWAVPELLGLRDVAVHRSLGGPSALFDAIRGHEPARREGTRLVLAVDASRAGRAIGSAHGALAVALALGGERGVTIEDVGSHRHRATESAPGFRPDRLPRPAGGEPGSLLLLGDPERLVSVARAAGEAGFAPAVVPQAPPGTGPAPTTPFALALRALASEPAPHPFGLVGLGTERDLYVTGKVSAPIVWAEAAPTATVTLAAPPAPDDERRLDARSEGAYVPRPRYLENLPSRWRLEADWCPGCQSLTFPIRGACARCGDSEHLERRPLSHHGWTVEAATTVRPGAQPTEFDLQVAAAGAYGVVIARAPEGPRGTFQVAGPAASVPLGTSIRLVIRRLYPMEGEWRYGRKAVVPVAPA